MKRKRQPISEDVLLRYVKGLNELNDYLKHNQKIPYTLSREISKKYKLGGAAFYAAADLRYFIKINKGVYKSNINIFNKSDALAVLNRVNDYAYNCFLRRKSGLTKNNKYMPTVRRYKKKESISILNQETKINDSESRIKIDKDMPIDKKIEFLKKLGIKGNFTIEVNI